ncbi:hypothetical protein HY970_01080 [Candidatus Kaiserbacteria bacterium]|nr:hypothetical protein [Candidatus Kaiserbacteria bacterium]
MKYLVSALVLFLVPITVSAQFDIPGLGGTDSIRVSPAYPKPNERIELTLTSISHDLGNSTITWRKNGTLLTEGVGATRLEIVGGALGEKIEITAESDSGDVHAEALIVPSRVDMLWEGDTYTPPFYRGRALPSAGAQIRIEAVPHLYKSGSEIDPTQLTYTWKHNGTTLAFQSGRGKSSATIDSSFFSDVSVVSVQVATADTAVTGEGSVRIDARTPELFLYEESPLFGILYHRALTTSNLIQNTEATFVALPYFAPAHSATAQELSYEWEVNRTPVSAEKRRPNVLTINAEKSTGLASVSLTVTHTRNVFFEASGIWNMIFGLNGSGGTSPFTNTL